MEQFILDLDNVCILESFWNFGGRRWSRAKTWKQHLSKSYNRILEFLDFYFIDFRRNPPTMQKKIIIIIKPFKSSFWNCWATASNHGHLDGTALEKVNSKSNWGIGQLLDSAPCFVANTNRLQSPKSDAKVVPFKFFDEKMQSVSVLNQI